MAEWIGGLLSGLPTWLVVIILIIIFMAMVVLFPVRMARSRFGRLEGGKNDEE